MTLAELSALDDAEAHCLLHLVSRPAVIRHDQRTLSFRNAVGMNMNIDRKTKCLRPGVIVSTCRQTAANHGLWPTTTRNSSGTNVSFDWQTKSLNFTSSR